MKSDFLVIPLPIHNCSGCIHIFLVRDKEFCDLGEQVNLRCSKFRITAKVEK
jgi:hypothetical protein